MKRGTLNAYYQVKEPNLKRLQTIRSNPNRMTFWERQNYGDGKKFQWLPGVREEEGRMDRQSTEDLPGSDITEHGNCSRGYM